MNDIKRRKLDLAASLWVKPGNFEELKEREFLKGISDYSLDQLLRWCETDHIIYEKKGKFYCYKNTVVKILNPAGYELD